MIRRSAKCIVAGKGGAISQKHRGLVCRELTGGFYPNAESEWQSAQDGCGAARRIVCAVGENCTAPPSMPPLTCQSDAALAEVAFCAPSAVAASFATFPLVSSRVVNDREPAAEPASAKNTGTTKCRPTAAGRTRSRFIKPRSGPLLHFFHSTSEIRIAAILLLVDLQRRVFKDARPPCLLILSTSAPLRC